MTDPSNARSRPTEHTSLHPFKEWMCSDSEEYIKAIPKSGGDPLDNLYKRMKEYDKNKCDAWRDEIDKLLIFAGLFSATVTTFAVNSYQWLQEDHTATSAKLLAQISLQLSVLATNATTPNPSQEVQPSPFVPDTLSVRVNILWFMSLIMCLSTVIFGILCLQWIREFTREISMPVKVAIPVRQLRYEGLRSWKVPELISALPVILQASVLLFFAGILDLLWSLHSVVAAFSTVLVGLVIIALAFTAFAPLIHTICAHHSHPPNPYKQCPYKSPLALVLLRFAASLDPFMQSFLLSWRSRFRCHLLNAHKMRSWADADAAWHRLNFPLSVSGDYDIRGFVDAFEWSMKKLLPQLNQDVTRDIFHAIHSTLPRVVSREVLQNWARSTACEDDEVSVALNLDKYDSKAGDAQYELLKGWFLRRCSPAEGCRDLKNELRVRCLNTMSDDIDKVEPVLHRLVNDYRFSELAWDPKEDDLDSQVILTMMRYHRTKTFRRHAFGIGTRIFVHIRRMRNGDGNIPFTYMFLKRLKSILDEIYQSAESWGPPHYSLTEDGIVPMPSEWGDWHPRNVAIFLCQLDLSRLRQWEVDIENTGGKLEAIQITERLVLFLKNILLPALPDQTFRFAEYIAGNIARFHHYHQLQSVV